MDQNELKQEVLKAITAAGYKAYMRKPEDTWCNYTDGTRIAHIQWGRSTIASHGVSVRMSTVHVPNKITGTGFCVDTDGDPLTPEALESAFAFCPAWALESQRRSVVKYRDWEHFRNSSNWNSEYTEVMPE